MLCSGAIKVFLNVVVFVTDIGFGKQCDIGVCDFDILTDCAEISTGLIKMEPIQILEADSDCVGLFSG